MKKYLTINIPVIPLIAIITVVAFSTAGVIIERNKSEVKKHARNQCSRYCVKVWDRSDSYYDNKGSGICQCGWGTSQVGHVHGIKYYSIGEPDG